VKRRQREEKKEKEGKRAILNLWTEETVVQCSSRRLIDGVVGSLVVGRVVRSE
jgi:hypothetical protein